MYSKQSNHTQVTPDFLSCPSLPLISFLFPNCPLVASLLCVCVTQGASLESFKVEWGNICLQEHGHFSVESTTKDIISPFLINYQYINPRWVGVGLMNPSFHDKAVAGTDLCKKSQECKSHVIPRRQHSTPLLFLQPFHLFWPFFWSVDIPFKVESFILCRIISRKLLQYQDLET